MYSSTVLQHMRRNVLSTVEVPDVFALKPARGVSRPAPRFRASFPPSSRWRQIHRNIVFSIIRYGRTRGPRSSTLEPFGSCDDKGIPTMPRWHAIRYVDPHCRMALSGDNTPYSSLSKKVKEMMRSTILLTVSPRGPGFVIVPTSLAPLFFFRALESF